ncbi:hypothetical protein EV189_2326 [Motilibacter rhizosphaerae]|uniref:Uncharacterized protein n=1 Tax=Motilibacter rhizosphaerae TaxID=598652 RepID=A0A4Q7NPF1_9ACTN|nr:hypothetical protein [Motilibacter rhizosphaerae]RZS86908.1 hypothetical protein EV189_2326 [Motilibacter rhizosphaerae]
MNPDLVLLGDELQTAVSRSLTTRGVVTRRSRRLRSRGTLVAGVATAVVVAGAGSAAAYALLGSGDVATGLPAANVWFAGVQPVCTSTGDSTFRCTVEGGLRSTAVSDWTGTIEPFTGKDERIAGGCRSQDAKGTVWVCYSGQKAVDEQLIGQDFLGEYAPEPGVG